MKSIDYQPILVLPNSRFKSGEPVQNFGNTVVLESMVKSSDLLLVEFDLDLNYDDYFKALDCLQNFRVSLPDSMHGILKKPYIIEVTFELEISLKSKEFDIFNQ